MSFQISNFLVMTLIPMLLLTVLNLLIFQRIRRWRIYLQFTHQQWKRQILKTQLFRATKLHNSVVSSSAQRSDSTMAALLFGIVIVFFLCHSTKLITSTFEAYQMVYYGQLMRWPPWAEVLSRWNHFMLCLNASVNIFIYVFKVIYSIVIFYNQFIFRIRNLELFFALCS